VTLFNQCINPYLNRAFNRLGGPVREIRSFPSSRVTRPLTPSRHGARAAGSDDDDDDDGACVRACVG
jgi:hypothetical protein